MAVGGRIFAALDQGFRTHDYSAFLALITDDFEYRQPVVPPMQGRAAIEQYYKMAATNGTKLLFDKPIRMTASETTIMMEFESRGDLAGESGYHNYIAYSFDVVGDKTSGAREYWGQIDIDLTKRVMDKSKS